MEGSSWYMQNNYDHRDAALEEILHLVHDAGIGVDGAPTDGALPEFQMEIRKATENAMPTWWKPPGKGIWAEDRSESQEWLKELDQENSLTQEYLASVIDSAYGLWGPWDGTGGMWGLYDAKTPDEIASADPMGAALLPKFFQPYYTWMVMLDPSLKGKSRQAPAASAAARFSAFLSVDQHLNAYMLLSTGTFSLQFNKNLKYTWKSQFITHATLLGKLKSNLKGNARDNRLGPNGGRNILDGGDGTDTAVFQGKCSEYAVSSTRTMLKVKDTVAGRDSLTILKNIERMEFSGDDGSDPCQITTSPESVSSCGALGWDTGAGSEAVCATSSRLSGGDSCKAKATARGAESTCKSVGARLCTLMELANKEASVASSECGFPQTKKAWTATLCNGGAGRVMGSPVNGMRAKCTTKLRRKGVVMCCADAS